MSDIHSCPHCDLRFLNRAELDDHIAREHPSDLDDDTTELDR